MCDNFRMEEIPLISADRQRVAIRVGGLDAVITVWWQPRQGEWFASLEVPRGAPLVSGRVLAADAPLLGGIVSPLKGDIWCRPAGGAAVAPGRDAWGTTHRLTWEPAA